MRKLSLANLPTKIEKLVRWSAEKGVNIYIKRDDQTGSEWNGNKIRKLEFAIHEARDRGCDLLITCGGIQSNHCRATVAAATRLGMKSAVLLRIEEEPPLEGNYFLDRLMGAAVRFCTRPEYSNSRTQIMEEMAQKYHKEGYKPYIIPEGASYPVGALGYFHCMKEIVAQEEQMGITFDTIVVATGSGGTHTGLTLANLLLGYGKRVVGMAVCDDNAYFQNVAMQMTPGCLDYLVEQGEIGREQANEFAAKVKPSDFEYIDGYVGIGYAKSRHEELEHIKRLAGLEGVVFDPVYTGKATYGLDCELGKGGAFEKSQNILFIHTGGIFGLFPVSRSFPLK
ncbi:MAG TPA: D-cysteine desulfhydrase family protein [Bacteroidales bacterium]|nr:D-cysteine desulfhydrase family protein [Bacteroidales bacterium]